MYCSGFARHAVERGRRERDDRDRAEHREADGDVDQRCRPRLARGLRELPVRRGLERHQQARPRARATAAARPGAPRAPAAPITVAVIASSTPATRGT